MKTKNGLFANVSPEEWNDWKWQVRNRIQTLEDLKKYMSLTQEEEEGVRQCLGKLRMAVTPYYLSLIDLDDPLDPIRRQAIPTAFELYQSPEDLVDPLHEDTDSPVKGLTHRYPDRVLFLITDQCSMYCRHCTRRRFAGCPRRPFYFSSAACTHATPTAHTAPWPDGLPPHPASLSFSLLQEPSYLIWHLPAPRPAALIPTLSQTPSPSSSTQYRPPPVPILSQTPSPSASTQALAA